MSEKATEAEIPIRGRRGCGCCTGALALLLLAAICGGYGLVHVFRQPEPGPPPEPVRELASIEERLQRACANSWHLELEVLGEVRHGDFTAPLWHVHFEPSGEVRQRIFVSGGVHGNEPAGTEHVVRLVEALSLRPRKYDGFAFDIVPLVNPWGWMHDRRHNGQDLDLNRDFASFQTREAQLIRDLLYGQRFDWIVDHHEDSDAKGFYLYHIASEYPRLCRRIIEREKESRVRIEQDVWMVFLKTEDGIIDAPLWSLRLARTVRWNSLANYLRLEHTETAFLVETPTRLPKKERLRLHEDAFETFLKELKP